MSEVALEVKELNVSFGALRALRNVSFTLPEPGVYGLIGPNGAGKSTLLNVLSGFIHPDSGELLLSGQDIAGYSIAERVQLRMLRSFQTARLLEDETVLSNVMVGRERILQKGALRQIVGTPGARREERQTRAEAQEVLNRLGLQHEAARRATELSTAARRLVELGRALIGRPQVLLLDEPAAGLDAGSRILLTDRLREVSLATSCLIVLVEHDVGVVRRVCDRTIVLASGEMVAEGPTDSVLDDPRVRDAYFGEGSDA